MPNDNDDARRAIDRIEAEMWCPFCGFTWGNGSDEHEDECPVGMLAGLQRRTASKPSAAWFKEPDR